MEKIELDLIVKKITCSKKKKCFHRHNCLIVHGKIKGVFYPGFGFVHTENGMAIHCKHFYLDTKIIKEIKKGQEKAEKSIKNLRKSRKIDSLTRNESMDI